MSRARVRHIGEVLRRVADRLDPPRPAVAGEQKLVSRQELREIQKTGLQMVDDFVWLSRDAGRDDGLLWIPRDVLANVTWLIEVELDVRDRDYAAIENDPGVVLR